MRLLWISERFAPDSGGVAQSSGRIASGLAQRGHELHVLRLARNELLPGTLHSREAMGLHIHELTPARDEDETCQLVEAWVSAQLSCSPAVVVTFFAGAAGLAALLGGLRWGAPTLLCLRGNDLDRGIYRGKFSGLLQLCLSRASEVACVTREQQRKLASWLGRSGRYLPNSVDGDFFCPSPQPRALDEAVLVVGEMRLKKGLALILQMAEQSQLRFRLQGGMAKSDRPLWEDWCRRHPHSAQRVELHPYTRSREELRELYRRSPVVWHPALWEGMPNVVLEAMACASTVVTHRVGGCCDLIESGRDGYLLGLEELHQTLPLLTRLLQQPCLEVGRRARERVLAHHRPEQELEGYELLLAELADSALT